MLAVANGHRSHTFPHWLHRLLVDGGKNRGGAHSAANAIVCLLRLWQCTAKNVMYCYILVLSSIKHHQPLLDAICKTSSCLNDPWPMIVQYCTASPFFNWPLEISWLPDTLELAYWAPLRSWTSVALWMGNKWLFIIHYSILFIILQYCRNIGTLQHPTTYNKA